MEERIKLTRTGGYVLVKNLIGALKEGCYKLRFVYKDKFFETDERTTEYNSLQERNLDFSLIAFHFKECFSNDIRILPLAPDYENTPISVLGFNPEADKLINGFKLERKSEYVSLINLVEIIKNGDLELQFIYINKEKNPDRCDMKTVAYDSIIDRETWISTTSSFILEVVFAAEEVFVLADPLIVLTILQNNRGQNMCYVEKLEQANKRENK